MDPISLEDLALLEVLKRVDQHTPLAQGDSAISARMLEAGLVAEDADGELALTAAGVEMCKSLQHRVAADAQVARILEQRENADGAAPGSEVAA